MNRLSISWLWQNLQLFLCTKDKVQNLIQLKQSKTSLSNLVLLITVEPLTSEDESLVAFARENKILLRSFDQVIHLGGLTPVETIPPSPESVYTISFTSGTTLAPKGVVLTHKSAVASAVFVFSNHIGDKHSRYYCFLPLAHIYARMSVAASYMTVTAVGVPQSSSPLTLLDDIKSLKPHNLALIPRALLRFESAIKAATVNNLENPLLAKLFQRAIQKKMDLMQQHDGAEGKSFFADILIGLLRKKLGMENLKTIGSGSAPLSAESILFLKASLNVGLSQGYGSTESFAGVCGSLFYEADVGSCGPIAINCEARLRDLPEMNYYSNDPKGPSGELMLRGPQIFKEYYKNPSATAEVKDADGWFRTGDVARFDPVNGHIFIIDRIKNFFKLSQGEYVTPEKIENIYMSFFPFLSQIYVHGDCYNSYLISIVGIEESTIKPWIKAKFRVDHSSEEELLNFMNRVEVKKEFLKEMSVTTKGYFQGFERLHNIRIAIEPLKAEDGVLTPTMKIKRENAKTFFQSINKELYQEGSIIFDTDTKL